MHVSLTFEGAPPLAALQALDELSEITAIGATVTALLMGSPDRLLKEAARHTVLRWSAQDRSLEDLFLDHYRVADGDAPGPRGSGR